MNWELLVGTRYLRSRRRAFLSLISALSLAGVTIGVATLLIVLAVMSGLESELRNKILGFNPQVTLASFTGGVEDWRDVLRRVREVPDVQAASPVVYGQAMLGLGRSVSGGVVRGIDPTEGAAVIDVGRHMTGGSLDDLGRSHQVTLPVAASLWRRLTGQSLVSATVVVQHLTLWIGFLGALLATWAGKHLHLTTIDLVPAGRPRNLVRLFTNWVAAGTTALLAYASAKLVHAEAEGSRLIVGGIPFWWSMTVMPVACGAMALAFALRAPPGRRRGLARLGGLSVVVLVLLLGEAAVPDPGGWPLDRLGRLGDLFTVAAGTLREALGPLATPGFLVPFYGLAVVVAFLLAPLFE